MVAEVKITSSIHALKSVKLNYFNKVSLNAGTYLKKLIARYLRWHKPLCTKFDVNILQLSCCWWKKRMVIVIFRE